MREGLSTKTKTADTKPLHAKRCQPLAQARRALQVLRVTLHCTSVESF